MSGGELMAVIGFFIAVSGALWGVWWRVEGKIKESRQDAMVAASAAQAHAALAREELAAHKLHVAQQYVTKEGMQEQTEHLLKAIEGIGNKLDRTNERLDRVFEQPARSTRSAK